MPDLTGMPLVEETISTPVLRPQPKWSVERGGLTPHTLEPQFLGVCEKSALENRAFDSQVFLNPAAFGPPGAIRKSMNAANGMPQKRIERTAWSSFM